MTMQASISLISLVCFVSCDVHVTTQKKKNEARVISLMTRIEQKKKKTRLVSNKTKFANMKTQPQPIENK